MKRAILLGGFYVMKFSQGCFMNEIATHLEYTCRQGFDIEPFGRGRVNTVVLGWFPFHSNSHTLGRKQLVTGAAKNRPTL